MSILFDRYGVTLTLERDMLGTNPCDPNVLDNHIIGKERKLILEKSEINKEVNKYLNALQISDDKAAAEKEALIDKLESLTGISLTPEERSQAMAGKLESLKETFEGLETTGVTVFLWSKELNKPMIGDHMIYGFLKAAADAIAKTRQNKKKGAVLDSSSYTASIINQHVRCGKQFIVFDSDVKRKDDGVPEFLQRSLRAMTAKGPRISLAKSEVVPAGAKLEFELKVLSGSTMTEDVLRLLFSYGELSGLGQWRNAGYGQFTFELKKID